MQPAGTPQPSALTARHSIARIALASFVVLLLATVLWDAQEGTRGPLPTVMLTRDSAPPGGAAADEEPPPITQRYKYRIPRATSDRADITEGSLLHPVYLVPRDATDEHLDELGIIEDSMRAQNEWFRQQSGGLQWRLDTFEFEWDDPATPQDDQVTIEAVDVTFIRSSLSTNELVDGWGVSAELRSLGLAEVDKRYLSYVVSHGDGACGDAIYSVPVDPNYRGDGKFAQVYLDSPPGCMARHFAPDARNPSHTEATAQHEIAHTDDTVSPLAPHTCHTDFGIVGHVCLVGFPLADQDPERFDLMFPYSGVPLDQKSLDLGRDDYFRHPWPYRDLDESVYLEPAA